MEDKQIIELYWNRLEKAIEETSQKYGRFCHYIANNILKNREDSDECVNDTYLRAWNAIPPERPESLRAFLAKITRNLALNKWEKNHAQKREKDTVSLALEELSECVPSTDSVESVAEQMLLTDTLNMFLASLESQPRKIFMARYFYFASIKEIASEYNIGESKVKMTLLRTRDKLKQLLEKEGIIL